VEVGAHYIKIGANIRNRPTKILLSSRGKEKGAKEGQKINKERPRLLQENGKRGDRLRKCEDEARSQVVTSIKQGRVRKAEKEKEGRRNTAKDSKLYPGQC